MTDGHDDATSLFFLIDPLKPSGNYTHHLIQQSVNLEFCIYLFYVILSVNSDYFFKQNNQLFFIKCCVLIEVRTELLNII
jgi:hypothetical protein